MGTGEFFRSRVLLRWRSLGRLTATLILFPTVLAQAPLDRGERFLRLPSPFQRVAEPEVGRDDECAVALLFGLIHDVAVVLDGRRQVFAFLAHGLQHAE